MEPYKTVYFVHRLSPKFDHLLLYGISDIHYGSFYFSPKHFDRMLEALKPPEAYAILNGDLPQADIRMSKGDIFKQVGTPGEQRDWLIEKLKPYKEKILGCTRGNHGLRIYEQTGVDLEGDIAKALGCPYDPDGIWLKIIFGEGNNSTKGKPYVYYVYATHGSGGCVTSGAKAMKIKRMATYIHASVYFQSHDHTEHAEPESYLMPYPHTSKVGDWEMGSAIEHQKMLVKTGSTQLWGGHAKRSGHAPSQLGTPMVILKGTGKPWVNVLM